MNTLAELLRQVFAAAPGFAERLNALKTNTPGIEWYPFRSLDKIHLIAKLASHFDAASVPLTSERARVLDIGTADGDLSFLFESVGCEVVAIDNAPSNYNRCAGVRSMRELLESKVTLVEKDIDYDFSVEGQYDLILMLDILYHLRNPLGSLISLCQLGKYMIITTRIFETVDGDTSVRDVPYGYLLRPFEAAHNDPTNYWMFTETAFQRLLERGGWQILSREYFGYVGDDSSPFESSKDKRIVALCQRLEGHERLKYGHFIGRETADTAPAAWKTAAIRPDLGSFQLRQLELALSDERARLNTLTALLEARDELIRTICSSKSWRLTAPLRAVTDVMRRCRRHAGTIVSSAVEHFRSR